MSNGSKVVVVHDPSLPDVAEVRRLQSLERFVGDLFDEWVGTCSDLMALYDGLSWDETIPLAASEIRGLREIAAHYLDGNGDAFLLDWSDEARDALASAEAR
jgi:hypothetical protein